MNETSADKLTVSSVAKMLDVSRSHVYRLINRGELTPHRNPLYRKHAPVTLDAGEVAELVRRTREENGWGRDDEEVEPRGAPARAPVPIR